MFLKEEEVKVLKNKYEDTGERIGTKYPAMSQLLVALFSFKNGATKTRLLNCNWQQFSRDLRDLFHRLRPARKGSFGTRKNGNWDVFDWPDRFKKTVVKAKQLGLVKVDSIADNWPKRFDMYDTIKITKKGKEYVEVLRKRAREEFKEFREQYEKKNAKKIIQERILEKGW